MRQRIWQSLQNRDRVLFETVGKIEIGLPIARPRRDARLSVAQHQDRNLVEQWQGPQLLLRHGPRAVHDLCQKGMGVGAVKAATSLADDAGCIHRV